MMRIRNIKLSDEHALAIYNDPRPYGEIAKDYDVHYTVVSGIKYGDTYKGVTGGKKRRTRTYQRYSKEMVQAVYTASGSYPAIAEKFHMPVATVNAIKCRILRAKDTEGLTRGKPSR